MQKVTSSKKGPHCPPNIINTSIENLGVTWPCPISEEGKETKDLIKKCSDINEEVIDSASCAEMTIEEAANYLGRTAQTLRNWERKGDLVPERTSGKHRRYTEKQLIPFRKKQMSPPEIIIQDIHIERLRGIFSTLLGNFSNDEKVTLTIQIDTLDGVVRISIDSKDGLNGVTKTFRMEEHE